MQDVEVEDKVDVIISEWMGYMLLYEVHSFIWLFFASQFDILLSSLVLSPSDFSSSVFV